MLLELEHTSTKIHVFGWLKQIILSPDSRAEDYSAHIIDAFSTAASTYCDYKKTCPESDPQHTDTTQSILSTVYKKITCTMTDRAAVNDKTRRMLQDALEEEFIGLNCNVHCLDTFTSEVRGAMKSVDHQCSIKGALWGDNPAAVNLIQCLSKIG